MVRLVVCCNTDTAQILCFVGSGMLTGLMEAAEGSANPRGGALWHWLD